MLSDDQDTRWMELGACAGIRDDSLFPEGDVGADIAPAEELMPDRETAAKAWCEDCDVRSECLAYALINKEPAGVWGGLTAVERTDLLELVEQLNAEAENESTSLDAPEAEEVVA